MKRGKSAVMSFTRPVLVASALLAFAACSLGCSHVAPYERSKLAHPTMAAGDMSSPGQSHVRSVLEGARGGNVGAESGCGCN
jgi:Domain of unknown function (DUF4266)